MLSGELDHKPQLPILLTLTEDLDPPVLRRWVRAKRAGTPPIDLLLARDYPAFEDAIEDFRERGLVLGGR